MPEELKKNSKDLVNCFPHSEALNDCDTRMAEVTALSHFEMSFGQNSEPFRQILLPNSFRRM